ncbi:fumarylacetoacetate hydrolase family protein [Streptomyces sp. AC495_CC817]|uniref:fumarylacetoacetate hydrolase family protein n=1 Tax=Streptomyces sp. AC495_CC817 TaxID=2823900 RepID=UPI001C26EE45|nr:fumarylacetoacetate hydrolase family protein [Streptomyces sp. AC495_CC817]
MKFVTFHRPGDPKARLGLDNNDDETYTDLTARFPDDPAFASMLALIDAGDRGLDAAWHAYQRLDGSALVARDAVTLLPPFTPRRMRDCGLMVSHLRQSMSRTARWLTTHTDDERSYGTFYEQMDGAFRALYDPSTPVQFAERNPQTVSAPHAVLEWPAESEHLDYELELAAVIGKGGSRIAAADAEDHIFGYTVYNDWTLRDVQARNVLGGGDAHGDAKDFPQSNSFGPCVVTRDEIGDPHDLRMTVRVNGEVWGEGSSSQMIHTFPQAVEDISAREEIVAGEVWGTGTVRNGSSFEIGRRLPRPAFVELEIEKIGILSQYVVPAP